MCLEKALAIEWMLDQLIYLSRPEADRADVAVWNGVARLIFGLLVKKERDK
jgi:hypothetical protein